MKKACFIFGLLFFSFLLMAENFTVEYLEGIPSAFIDNSWVELWAGDTVPESAQIKLDNQSSIELSGIDSGLKIYLSKAGTYSLGQLAESSREMKNSGVSELIKDKIEVFGQGSNKKGHTVGGVRASEAIEKPAIEFSNLELEEIIKKASTLMKNDKYTEALEVYQEGFDYASASELDYLYFSMAYCYSQQSKFKEALAYLGKIKNSAAFYSEHTLLKSRLLINTYRFDEALSWIHSIEKSQLADSEKQAVLLFEYMAYKAKNERDSAKKSLETAVKINKDSEEGKKAAVLLKKL